MSEAEWYVIPRGTDAGLWHMQGWTLHARLGLSSGPRDDGWLAYATCPRCGAMVLTKQRGEPGDWIGSEIRLHENWHHRTDHPHPETAAAGTPGAHP